MVCIIRQVSRPGGEYKYLYLSTTFQVLVIVLENEKLKVLVLVIGLDKNDQVLSIDCQLGRQNLAGNH